MKHNFDIEKNQQMNLKEYIIHSKGTEKEKKTAIRKLVT